MTFLDDLARASSDADGAPPFSDQALVDARAGRATVLGDERAAAVLRDGEVELAVRPDHRRRGLGGELLAQVLDETEGSLAAWAHGDLPGSRVLAERHGFRPVRTLLQQRAAVPAAPRAPRPADGDRIEAFRPGTDEEAWLDLNRRAFADHPEQGGLDRSDLDARLAEDWFDADDLLLLHRGGELLASCWLKVEPGAPGEFYAVAVAPGHQGEGLGGAVVDAGLVRLAERGVATASLYVEGDNAAALGLYASRGFTDHAVDVQHRLDR